MNLMELYQQIPTERHKDIKVTGDGVFVKGTDGSVDEYLICGEEQELWLIRSDREQRQDIKAIKSKLGMTEVKL